MMMSGDEARQHANRVSAGERALGSAGITTECSMLFCTCEEDNEHHASCTRQAGRRTHGRTDRQIDMMHCMPPHGTALWSTTNINECQVARQLERVEREMRDGWDGLLSLDAM